MIRRSLTQAGCALLMGGGLGILWDFLRPLSGVRRTAADFLFILGAAWALCVLNFGVCGGDLRLACALVSVPGFCLEQAALSGLTAPVFYGFWSILARLGGLILWIPKKFFKIAKNVFASAGKWVTIGRKNRSEPKSSPRR